MKKIFLPIAIIAFFSVSCNAGKKFEQAEAKVNTLNSEVSRLTLQNARLDEEVTGLNQKVNGFRTAGEQCNGELAKARASGLAATQRFDELSRCLDEQADSLQQIKRKALNDLGNFDHSMVQVKYLNGMVYISMQDQFMFSSGSTKINPGGMKALTVIAEILARYGNVSAIVVGNTDTLHIIRGLSDNWSLSTERSNAIIRYLINHYQVDPARLIAAGRSEFNPVASNSTVEGRSKNRRTDIIINPDLHKLWLLSQKYP
jgi:chemotaxis protein MotB